MAKKRGQVSAGIPSEGGKKKRKAAEASSAKIKLIADIEDDGDLQDDSEVDDAIDVPIASRPPAKQATKKVEDMPLMAPGLRLWEGFAEAFAGTDLAALAKYDDKTTSDEKALDVQRRYGTTLKPLMVTEGPLAGSKVLVVQAESGFRFLVLPPEIRNKVYGYLLEETAPIGIDTYSPKGKAVRSTRKSFAPGSYVSRQGLIWDKATCRWLGQPPSAFALLRVCKQLLQETAPIAYGNNTFEPISFYDFHTWLEAIGSMRRYVRHFKIPYRPHGRSHMRSICSMLQSAVDLRSITIDHATVCSPVMSFQPAQFASKTGPLLKALQRQFIRSGARSPRELLDIVQVTWEKCYRCKSISPGSCYDYGGGCAVKCPGLGEHCKQLEAEFRVAIAGVLGLKEEL